MSTTPAAAPRDEEVRSLAQTLRSVWFGVTLNPHEAMAAYVLTHYTPRAASESCDRCNSNLVDLRYCPVCGPAPHGETRPTPSPSAPATEAQFKVGEWVVMRQDAYQRNLKRGDRVRIVTASPSVYQATMGGGDLWLLHANEIEPPPAPVPPATHYDHTKALASIQSRWPSVSPTTLLNLMETIRRCDEIIGSDGLCACCRHAADVLAAAYDNGAAGRKPSGEHMKPTPAKGEEGAGVPVAWAVVNKDDAIMVLHRVESNAEIDARIFSDDQHFPREGPVGETRPMRVVPLYTHPHDAAALLREAHDRLHPLYATGLRERIDAYLKGHDAAAHDGKGEA